MNPQEYHREVDRLLERVATWLEPFDPDQLDYQQSDGVISLIFADRARFVLNRQAAVQQMWYAAGARAWHYDFDATRKSWIDDRDGHVLTDNLVATVRAKLGANVPEIGP